MHLPHDLFPPGWLWASGVIYLIAFSAIARHCPWSQLKDSERQHVFFGACVLLMVLWSIRASIYPGFSYHYLGATLLTLVFGWQLAIVAISLVLGIFVLFGIGDWQVYALDASVMGLMPVGLSQGIYWLVRRTLPQNFFIYLFLCAFFAGALSVLATTILSLALAWAAGGLTLAQLWQPLFAPALLLAFPEAFITGTIILTLVMQRPQWVSSYQEPDAGGDR